MTRQKGWSRLLLTAALAANIALSGCSSGGGDDGANGINGVDGVNGQDGQPGQNLTTPATAVTTQINAVTVPTPAAVAGTAVEFSLKDQNNQPVATLPTGASVSFTLVKLTTDATGNTAWKSYINRVGAITGADNVGSGPGNTPAITTQTIQATTQGNAASVIALGGGNYRYTFTATGVTTPEAVPFEANLTHRVGIQVSGGGLAPVNVVKDFRPDGGTVATTRNIATTVSCLECHEGNFGFHGSSARIEVEYCVTCHNPGSIDPNSGESVDMANMIHKIHAGHQLPSVEAGGSYIIWGNRGSRHDYSHVGYPMLTQGLKNCRKCHTAADSATADGDNWKNRPTRLACASCHDDISFVNPAPAGKTLHTGGAMANDNTCASCHSGAAIEGYHMTNYATPNNPDVPAGLSNFTYDIKEVTVNASNQAEVKFKILRNGVSMDLSGTALPVDLTGGPSFLVAYAAPQGSIATPADWNMNQPGFGATNNTGTALTGAAQPATVSLATVRGGTQGTLSAPDAEGYYTATLNGPAAGAAINAARFPANATMRAVGLQGYFTQTEANGDINGDTDTADTFGRYTKSVIKGVTDDPQRRVVVENSKCLACHETLQLHGGNRVDEVALCVTCHNPNLSSSGRTLAFANPEEPQNLKDLVHAIHGAGKRENAFDFVRNFNGSARPFTFIGHQLAADYPTATIVTYPAGLSNCLMCHKEGTYYAAPTGALPTVAVTSNGTDTEAGVAAARLTVPNNTDSVISPTASACVSCHDSVLASAHMTQNGGSRLLQRSLATGIEACVLCHGTGRSADVKAAHGL